MNKEAYDVVYIGNYTKDTIVTPTGVRYVDGGGACYAAYAASRLGRKVAIVTHLAWEDAHVVDDLKSAGIACHTSFTPQSTLMKLEYPTTDPDIRSLSVEGIAGSFNAEELEGFDMKAAVIGSSLRGEVGLDVIRALHDRKVTVSADMQGFIRVLRGKELRNEPWEEMKDTLALVDILKSDAVEAEFLTGRNEIHQAAEVYASMGPSEIVLTHKDGLLIFAGGIFYELEFYPSSLDGRSGRGDTCIGTYVAMRGCYPPLKAGIWAAAVTSLKMETLGPFNRPVSDVEELIRERYNQISLPL
jgi:sugar/nucleoside kinase (ribokinase family)